MSPADAIAMLDRQVAEHGRVLVLRRYEDGSDAKSDHSLRGFVRGYRPDQLVGDMDPASSAFVLSPSSFPLGWAPGDDRWPVKGDFLVVDGRERKIEWIDPRVIGDTIVRFDGGLEG